MQRKKILSSSKLVNTLSIIILLCTIIGTFNILTNKPLYINPELKEYVDEFKRDGAKYNRVPRYGNLTVVFSVFLPDTIAGRCNPLSNSIEINADTWNFRPKEIKKALLYHELAHCALLRDHNEETFRIIVQCPVTLMYPSLDIFHFCYPPLEDYYIKELFTNPYNHKLIGE
jgi:hypothetical protein